MMSKVIKSKKLLVALVFILAWVVIIVGLTLRGGKKEVDVDYTGISKGELYSSVTASMFINTEELLGKTVKIVGESISVYSEVTGKNYSYIIIYGDKVIGTEELTKTYVEYTDIGSIIEDGSTIEITGVFERYEEEIYGVPYTYTRINSEKIEELGSESVSE
jgi:hypothetical protein